MDRMAAAPERLPARRSSPQTRPARGQIRTRSRTLRTSDRVSAAGAEASRPNDHAHRRRRPSATLTRRFGRRASRGRWCRECCRARQDLRCSRRVRSPLPPAPPAPPAPCRVAATTVLRTRQSAALYSIEHVIVDNLGGEGAAPDDATMPLHGANPVHGFRLLDVPVSLAMASEEAVTAAITPQRLR